MDKRRSADLLVVSVIDMKPLAVIELKHYSVHQPDTANRLLTLIIEDYKKHCDSRWLWLDQVYSVGKHNDNTKTIPLIQIGLLTAIEEHDCGNGRDASFIRKYLKYRQVDPAEIRAFCSAASKEIKAKLATRNGIYFSSTLKWTKKETITLPIGSTSLVIKGKVGYLCLLTR